MTETAIVEETRDDIQGFSLAKLVNEPGIWKRVTSFTGNDAAHDGCRAALERRDAGKPSGPRPVVRVRVGSETILVTQRLRWENKQARRNKAKRALAA